MTWPPWRLNWEDKAAAVLSTEKGVKLTTEGGAKLLTEQTFSVDPDVRASLIAAMAAWSLSESVTSYRPRILIAPGFSEDDAIGKALETAANKLRAVTYVDCESMATAQEVVTRRQMYGARVELLRPRVSKVKANGEITFRPYSASAAGLRARIDLEKGWWWSKSNQAIANILGVEQVDEFKANTDSQGWLFQDNKAFDKGIDDIYSKTADNGAGDPVLSKFSEMIGSISGSGSSEKAPVTDNRRQQVNMTVIAQPGQDPQAVADSAVTSMKNLDVFNGNNAMHDPAEVW